jgi:hypothetical protein
MSSDVMDRVRSALADAAEAGCPAPGRPTLVKLTGATDYQVRRALAVLASQDTSPPPATASPGEAGEVTVPASRQPADLLATDVASDPPAVTSAGDVGAMPSPAEPEPGDDVPPIVASVPPEVPGGGEPEHQPAGAARAPRPWPLLVIGLAAAVAVWSGWVGLGRLAGFGVIEPLPGIWDGFQINTAVVLPISVEAYAAYALRCWLGGGQFSPRTTNFARWSAIASLVIGAGAQVAYHLMAAAGLERAPWQITMLVACVPVAVLGLASALAKLVTSDHQAVASAGAAGDRR